MKGIGNVHFEEDGELAAAPFRFCGRNHLIAPAATARVKMNPMAKFFLLPLDGLPWQLHAQNVLQQELQVG
jgi:hypothetical protein